ncbi:MAG: hypothetical protein RBR43_03890 [Desulfuromonadaceae bacterium]|nr:hypothetical protein [Desulfuromonas sp.]MDY0185010.1 hypothetical protein [Desulfuromonadaceae bacterium]
MPNKVNVADVVDALGSIDVGTLLLSLMILCMALILRGLRRHMQRHEARRLELEQQLNHALQRINRLEEQQMRAHPVAQRTGMPSAAVPEEELISRLQSRPRAGDAPSRYRHVAALAQQGMDAAQIAEILHISVAETSQLMSLIRLAQNNSRR